MNFIRIAFLDMFFNMMPFLNDADVAIEKTCYGS